MCSIVVALVFRLLYWIIYFTGLAIGEKKGVVLIVVVFGVVVVFLPCDGSSIALLLLQ